ncbi:MAG: AraC family transcriptional regulator [Hyphomicrobiales bacterium]
MQKNKIISEIYRFISGREKKGELYFCERPEMVVVHDYTSMRLEKHVYRPVLCLVLQGEKEVWIGERRVVMRTGQAMIVSHDLPVSTRILGATPDKPYIAIVIEIDLALVRSLYDETSGALPATKEPQSVDVGDADDELVDAVGRLMALHANPLQAKVLEPLIRREIHFRLLMADHGGMLRELLRMDSHAGRVAKAIRRIHDGFRQALSVQDLARHTGMSPSTFHEHFKAVTGTSPLQYQKDIRLMEARRLLVEGTSDGGRRSVSSVAFDVGYESPTQFSREYSRKFEKTPRDELKSAAFA